MVEWERNWGGSGVEARNGTGAGLKSSWGGVGVVLKWSGVGWSWPLGRGWITLGWNWGGVAGRGCGGVGESGCWFTGVGVGRERGWNGWSCGGVGVEFMELEFGRQKGQASLEKKAPTSMRPALETKATCEGTSCVRNPQPRVFHRRLRRPTSRRPKGPCCHLAKATQAAALLEQGLKYGCRRETLRATRGEVCTTETALPQVMEVALVQGLCPAAAAPSTLAPDMRWCRFALLSPQGWLPLQGLAHGFLLKVLKRGCLAQAETGSPASPGGHGHSVWRAAQAHPSPALKRCCQYRETHLDVDSNHASQAAARI